MSEENKARQLLRDIATPMYAGYITSAEDWATTKERMILLNDTIEKYVPRMALLIKPPKSIIQTTVQKIVVQAAEKKHTPKWIRDLGDYYRKQDEIDKNESLD